MRLFFYKLRDRSIQFFKLVARKSNLISSIAIILVSVILLVSKYIDSLRRFFASVRDFVIAIANYFIFLFSPLIQSLFGSVNFLNVKINDIPNIDLKKYININFEELFQKLRDLNEALFTKDLFLEYNYFIADLGYKFSFLSLAFILCIVGAYALVRYGVMKKNDFEPGTMSVPFKVFVKSLEKAVLPIYRGIKDLIRYFYSKKIFRYTFIIIWIVALNVATIVLGLFSYYMYFVSSFDILSIGNQLLKLFIDLVIMFFGVPFIFWLVFGTGIFVYHSIQKGYKELQHMEAKNCGFLKTTDYIVLLKGPPGAGKTTLATDFALSWVNIHKAEALEIMMAMEMLFPAFSFASLRRSMNGAIDGREIDCIPRCDIYVDKLILEAPAPYLYNTKVFATERNTGTAAVTLDTAIRTYAKAYFMYYVDNSVMANYPIRFDGNFDDSKHLKKWNGDFFKRNAITAKDKSRYAKILDQDVFRLGKKVDPDNEKIGSFGYGIYVNTEWGKSRGNMLTTEDVRKDDEETNQKNDLYSYALKMCRHACSTVWHKVFFRFIGDEQRPDSLSADQRQLCTIIEIVDKSELKLALPCAKQLDYIYDKVYEPFCKFYVDYLNCRSDIILTVMLYKFVVAAFSRLYSYLYNTFGYYELDLSLEKGSEYGKNDNKGEIKIHKYYLMCKKVYSNRYNTDCHSAYFTKMQLDAKMNMIDYPTFAGLQQTNEEMDQQHDYFIMDMKGKMEIAENYAASKKTKTKTKKQAKTTIEPDVAETVSFGGVKFFKGGKK